MFLRGKETNVRRKVTRLEPSGRLAISLFVARGIAIQPSLFFGNGMYPRVFFQPENRSVVKKSAVKKDDRTYVPVEAG